MKENHQDELHSFIHIGSLLLRIVIFVLLGTHVDFKVVQQYLVPGMTPPRGWQGNWNYWNNEIIKRA